MLKNLRRVVMPMTFVTRMALIVCLGAISFANQDAAANTVLDQSFMNGTGQVNVGQLSASAQTFTVAVSGTLDSVEVNIDSNGKPFTLEIQSTTAAGAPSGTVLASVALPAAIGWAVADLSASNLTVTSGDHLAIVLLHPNNPFGWSHGQGLPATYAGGKGYLFQLGSWGSFQDFGSPNTDFWFRTFVTLSNADPIVDAGPNQLVECTGADGTLVALDGLAVDPDGDPLTFTWDVPAGVILDDPNIADPIGLFPIGVTTATLTVTDGQGGVDVDDVVITVVDTSPPEVACTTDLVALWPPKHQMVAVKVFIDATDVCTAPENLILLAVEVSSDEPDDGLGDGDTAGDVFGEDGFTTPVDVTTVFTFNPDTASFEGTILLRAERDAIGDGRAYTVEAFLVDTSLNMTSTSCVIVVPHDRRK